MIKVVHPQHGLKGEIVKVLGRDSGHWIIAKPDGRVEKLPMTWGEALSPIIVQAEGVGAWAGVTELLNLVKMMARLRVQPPEEVDDEHQHRCDSRDQQPAGEPCAVVGANSAGETTGTGSGSGGDAAQTEFRPGWAGCERGGQAPFTYADRQEGEA